MATMTFRASHAALILGFFIISCEDGKSTGSMPPSDLQLNDVVGCWWRGDGDRLCQLSCFDFNGLRLYKVQDSLGRWGYEAVGRFWISGYAVGEKTIGVNNLGVFDVDSSVGSSKYSREGEFLYLLDSRDQNGDRFDWVNLDSIIPCGKPFSLLPKPANWTLF